MERVSQRQDDSFELARRDLEAVLSSETFRRTPRLRQFLRFVCERRFDGRLDEIREYNIAVDALERPSTFDHTRDAIVRVEAYRLRKRLAEYYKTEGRDRPVRIDVPAGGYIPEFVEIGPTAASSGLASGPANANTRLLPAKWLVPTALLAIASIAASIAVAVRHTDSFSERLSVEPQGEVAVVRILAGRDSGGIQVDPYGRRWIAEPNVEGGKAVRLGVQPAIAYDWDSIIYESSRQGEFEYAIPLDPGTYEATLYFTEAEDSDIARKRRFDVIANGRSWLADFNILEDAGGPLTASIKRFADVSPGSDGVLRLRFHPRAGAALLNGIEIVKAPEGGLSPIRILAARDSPHYDEKRHNAFWSADRFVEGGTRVQRRRLVSGAENANIFAGERWGDFQYRLPVVPGRYRLTLYMAERWFGKDVDGQERQGARIFDIYCNGAPLIENFDLLGAAGGACKPYQLTFDDIRPNTRGYINLEFKPVQNYAMLNALELIPAK